LWLVQRSSTRIALHDDLSGDIVGVTCSASKLRGELAARGLTGLWAVLS
jgi:hypothetical protein